MLQNKKLFFLIIAFVTFLFDQVVKIIVEHYLDLNEKILLCPNILAFEKVYNDGAAFSIFSGNIFFLLTITFITLMIILFFVFKKSEKLLLSDFVAFGLIFGGALGNLLDRLLYQHVVDFIQFEFVNFPIFNCADIFINIGVIIFIVNIILLKNEKQ